MIDRVNNSNMIWKNDDIYKTTKSTSEATKYGNSLLMVWFLYFLDDGCCTFGNVFFPISVVW